MIAQLIAQFDIRYCQADLLRADEPEPAAYSANWGRPTPADALALRGLPAIGRGIGSGAIKGSVPGKNLY